MKAYPIDHGVGHNETKPIVDDITIVIPTLGRPILEECLHHIAGGSVWPATVIVVDQSSSPEVATWLARLDTSGLRAEHVPSQQRGRASGVNRGLERVQTQFVAVTDDDCFVDETWLAKLAEHLRQSPEAIVTGRVEAAGDEEVVALKTSLVPRIDRRPRLKHDSVCGGNMGVAISIIQRIGPLDEDPCLRTAEDCEWSYRALRAGVPVIYAPDVLVHHVGWRDKEARERQYASYARSNGGFYGKYLRKGDSFIALRTVIHLARALRRWILGLVTGNREQVLNGRAYVVGLLPGIINGWRAGRQG
jgi:GT2 family glycosyltransferase